MAEITSLFQAEVTGLYAQVVVERGVDRYPDGLTYGIPRELADLHIGERVIVPLGRGNRKTSGWVIDRFSERDAAANRIAVLDPSRIKSIIERDTKGVIPASLIDLAKWIDRYYCTPIGMVLASMLPGAVRKDIGRVMRTFVDVAGATGFQSGGSECQPGGTGFQPVTASLTIHKRKLPHWQVGGRAYFITFRLRRRQQHFSTAEQMIVANACLFWHSKRINLHVATVMPDHVHLLLTPLPVSDDTWHSIPAILQSIKSYSANEIHRSRDHTGPLWQEEYFDRIVRNESEFFEKWNYIRGNPVRAGLSKTAEEYQFTVVGDQDEIRDARTTKEKHSKLSPQQKRILETITTLPAAERPIEIHDLKTNAEVKTLGPIRKLIEKGLLKEITRSSIEAEWVRAAVDRFVPDELTADQQGIIDAIGATLDAGFSAHLIHGVTGSGKTEIYIHLIRRVIDAGKVALVLVPEIALTPQTGGRLIGRFPDARVAILHSGLTAAQRNQQWLMVRDGRAQIILGARSAVFAPLEHDRLGLIVVDEEHDSSYKQDQAPRYHGRDVAIRRAQLSNCPIILGSATPSLESWWNCGDPPSPSGRVVGGAGVDTHRSSLITRRSPFILHQLKDRVPGTKLPDVQIVDFRKEMRRRKDRTRVHLIGPTLESEIRTTLDHGYQVLILLNRRGYANYLACPDQNCGWTMQCDHCDVTMVYHRHRDIPAGGFVRCHHCQAEQRIREKCPVCGKRIVNFGLGTQRVEDELGDMFAELIEGDTMLRIDSDTMKSAKHFHDALSRFARGEVKLLLGTQMIAKGLDFPRVRLVGVINADTSINLPDFRASERTFQLVNQVAGRCGRADTSGRVVVQSFNPEALPIRLAAKHDYEGFARAELEVRKYCKLPPITRMARIVIRHKDHIKADELAAQLASRLHSIAEKSMRIRGPAPCPISRIAGKHRRQIELIAPTAKQLQDLLTTARNHEWVKSDAVTAVDVDPVALL